MYVRRLALPVTAVHSSCLDCLASVVCVSFGYIDDDKIQMIRAIPPLCPHCQKADDPLPWQDEEDWIESVNSATHE